MVLIFRARLAFLFLPKPVVLIFSDFAPGRCLAISENIFAFDTCGGGAGADATDIQRVRAVNC